MTEIDAKLVRIAKLRANLPSFASDCLRVRGKDEQIKAFIFNEAQHELHARIEQQKAEKGWVRALVLKGRQQGISTYVGARYYHRASMRSGVVVYILSHEQPSSDKLFDMVDRYQRLNPLAPHVGQSNAKSLVFDKLESSYTVATAGTKEGGRGGTSSLFHGSEVAFWANAPAHFAASVQGVPLLPGTEVILESTSAGGAGEFYERWMDAERGDGDYIPIFLPWWLSSEYARDPEAGFVLQKDPEMEGEMGEEEYADVYKLGLRQMCWRRNKIIELRSHQLFQREYPANPAEAWTPPPGMEPFISRLLVERAMNRPGIIAAGPLVIGVDPASNGGDRFSITARRGAKTLWTIYRSKIDHLEGIAWVRSIIDELKPARVNIDAGNIGAAIVTGLKSIGPYYANIVRGVNFGGTSEAKMAKPKVPGPKNRRAEMYQRALFWLMAPEGTSLPKIDALKTDICAARIRPQLNNDFLIESKEEMKKRGVRSPDLSDSWVLTFASNEYFDGYHTEESAAATPNRVTATLQGDTSTAYVPPPVLGGTGWMG